jgi:hypothetical protein
MESIAFALPTRASDEELIRRANEFLDQHEEPHHHQYRRHGFNVVKIWRQKHPIDAVIYYMEADNLREAITNLVNSDHPADRAAKELTEAITGHRPGEHGGEDAVLLADWHRERGHAKKRL